MKMSASSTTNFIVVLCILVAATGSSEHIGFRRALQSAGSACARELAKSFELLVKNGTELAAWESVADIILRGPTCASSATNASELHPVVISWRRFPAWFNGLAWKWMVDMRSDPTTASELEGTVFPEPVGLPPLGSFSSGSSMRDYMMLTQQAYALTSYDNSGMRPATAFKPPLDTVPENVCINGSWPRGLMHPRTYLLAFYRSDALARLHQAGRIPSSAFPDDWEELAALLAAHAAAVADERGASSTGSADGSATELPEHGLCITTHTECGRLGDVWAAIAASVVQTGGTTQGVYWDLLQPPPSSWPLVNTSGWQYATGVLRRLLAYNVIDYDTVGINNNSPEDGGASGRGGAGGDKRVCTDASQHFLAGSCLVTLDWDALFTSLASPAVRRPGVEVAVAPLPGSRRVMDRRSGSPTSGEVVDCNWQLCAASANHDLLYLGSAAAAMNLPPLAPEGLVQVDSGRDICDTQATLQLEAAAVAGALGVAERQRLTASAAPVSRAPYSALFLGHALTSIPEDTPIANRTFALIRKTFEGKLTSQAVMKAAAFRVARASLGYPPVNASTSADGKALAYARMRWWTALTEPFMVEPYTSRNMSSEAAEAYMRAVWHAMYAPNAAGDIPSPSLVNYGKWGLSHAALLLEPENGVSAAVASNTLTEVFYLMDAAFSCATLRSTYSDAVGATWTLQPYGVFNDFVMRSTKGMSTSALVALLVCLLVAALLSVLALYLLLLHLRHRRRDLLGRVKAPRAGPDTSLLVSDVQNSTKLWEELPAPVMDAALKIHHETFRREIARHDGYESATEGDSFLIAFSSPSSAVAFSSACQLALLHQDWPAELLAHPDGAAVGADPRVASLPLVGGTPQLTPVTSRRVRCSSQRRSLHPSLPLWRRLAHDDGHWHRQLTDALSNAASTLDDRQSGAGNMALPLPVALTLADERRCSFTHPSGSYDPSALTGSPDTTSSVDIAIAANVDRCMPMMVAGEGASGDNSEGAGYSLAASGSSSFTWRQILAEAFPVAAVPAARFCKAVATDAEQRAYEEEDEVKWDSCRQELVYAGLRVRMGIHSGLDDPQFVVFNPVGSSYKYYGPFAEVAKLVSDSAPGGLVILSGRAFARLRHGNNRGSVAAPAAAEKGQNGSVGGAVIVYAGHHILQVAPPKKAPSTFGRVGRAASSKRLMRTTGAEAPAQVVAAAAAAAPGGPRTRGAVAITLGAGGDFMALAARGKGAMGLALAAPPPQQQQHDEAPGVEEELPLYVALPAQLLCRLAHAASPLLRTVRETQLGSLDAPTGNVTIAFMKVVGASTLLSELPGPAASALKAFQRLACGLLGDAGGYQVEGGDGLLLAAFGSPLAGLRWALQCMARLREERWEDELLAHELCEEVFAMAVPMAGPSPPSNPHPAASTPALAVGGVTRRSLLPSQQPRRLLERGLRVKVGLDMGPVNYSLVEASGRLSYRGRVMNRAARIAGTAGPGQVLCSGAVWQAGSGEEVIAGSWTGRAGGEGGGDAGGVGGRWTLSGMSTGSLVGTSLGCVALKGISAPVEVVHCTLPVE